MTAIARSLRTAADWIEHQQAAATITILAAVTLGIGAGVGLGAVATIWLLSHPLLALIVTGGASVAMLRWVRGLPEGIER